MLKLVLFLILVVFPGGQTEVQILLVTSLFFLKLVLVTTVRTFNKFLIGFLKILNNVLLVGYFLSIYFINRKMRYLENKSEEELESFSEQDLE